MSRSSLLALLFLSFVVLVTWARSVGQDSEFIFDDMVFAVNNTATLATAVSQDSYAAAGYEGAPAVVYRPLGVLALAAERALFGVNSTRPWHLLSLLGHLAAVLLLFRWLLLLGLSRPGAIMASAVWAASPLHAESVAWIAAQFDVFSGVAALAAVLLAARATWPSAFLATLFFALAIGLKETMLVALPALVLSAWVGTAPRSDASGKRALPDRGQYAGTVALIGLVMVGSLVNLRSAVGVVSRLPEEPSIAALAASIGGAILRGAGAADILTVAGPPLHSPLLGESLAHLAAVQVGIRAVILRPGPALAVGSLLALCIPSLLFGQLEVGRDSDPDRYFYLASVAGPALLALAWPRRLSAHPRAVLLAAVIVVSFLSVRSIQETGHWRAFQPQLERQIELGRESGYLRYLLGEELNRQGASCAATHEFERALELIDTPGRRRQCAQSLAAARDICAQLQNSSHSSE
jgi:hypothetical protein